jgi:hypothetical protein
MSMVSLLQLLKSHWLWFVGAVVNCVQCHPFDCAIATSGIDSTIKVCESVYYERRCTIVNVLQMHPDSGLKSFLGDLSYFIQYMKHKFSKSMGKSSKMFLLSLLLQMWTPCAEDPAIAPGRVENPEYADALRVMVENQHQMRRQGL